SVVYSRGHVSQWTCNSLSLSTGGETPVQRPDAAHLADECKQSQPEFSCRVEMHSENVARCDLYRRDQPKLGKLFDRQLEGLPLPSCKSTRGQFWHWYVQQITARVGRAHLSGVSACSVSGGYRQAP